MTSLDGCNQSSIKAHIPIKIKKNTLNLLTNVTHRKINLRQAY